MMTRKMMCSTSKILEFLLLVQVILAIWFANSCCTSCTFLGVMVNNVTAFSPSLSYNNWIHKVQVSRFQPKLRPTLRCNSNSNNNEKSKGDNNNILQDLFSSAFANDRELMSSNNKRLGMLDEAVDNDDSASFIVLQGQSMQKQQELTPTQQAWRQKMLQGSSSIVQNDDLIGCTINVDLYLSGVPNKDPSNDLYASKTNISLRDRDVGQVLPSTPTISNIQVQFLLNGKCSVNVVEASSGDDDSSSSIYNTKQFIDTSIAGDWKLSDDGKYIRFRMQVYGFQRTIQTKGTIQKIYWSNEKESITETSTLYTIPQGWMYLETELSKRSNGSIQWTNSNSSNNPSTNSRQSKTSNVNGLIKIEQTTGFLGIATKMVPCGKFIVVQSSSSTDGIVV